MDSFYRRISKFISDNPAILKELQEKEALFSFLDINDTDKKKVFFDWFIFDHTSESLSQNTLSCFLQRADLSDDLKALYSRFAGNIYSIFEVKALRTGKEMIVHDLISDKEYQVRDTTITKDVSKRHSLFLRLLPFEDYYILASMGFGFPPSITPLMKLEIKNFKESHGEFKLTPLVMCNIFSAQDKLEFLLPQDRLRLFCREGGLSNSYIDDVLSELKELAAQKGNCNDILTRTLANINPYSGFNPEKLSSAFIDVWNSFISEGGEAEKGPIEKAIVGTCMGYVQNRVNPDDYPDLESAQKEVAKIQDKWFKTPKEELDGKSPEQVILEEREKLGNPQKIVKFRVELNRIEPGAEMEKKAKELFDKGLDLVRRHKHKEAIAVYLEYLALNSQNYVVWQNMGLSYCMLIDKTNAIRCFEKALEINPDYDIAKRNLRLVKKATKAKLEDMAQNQKTIWYNEGKEI